MGIRMVDSRIILKHVTRTGRAVSVAKALVRILDDPETITPPRLIMARDSAIADLARLVGATPVPKREQTS